MYIFKKNTKNYSNVLFSNNYINFSKYLNTTGAINNYSHFCKFINFINNNFFKIQLVSFSSNIYKNINNFVAFKFNFFINTFVIKKKKLLLDILLYFKKINIIEMFDSSNKLNPNIIYNCTDIPNILQKNIIQ
jgi:hypothetical protein